MRLDIGAFFENLSRKFKFHLNMTRITSTLHDDVCAFMISRRILLRVRYVSEKSGRDNQDKHCMFHNFFFLEIRAVCEIM
jgi:hypothetical protein